jgi:predicted HD phosphohydrolase
VAQRPLESRVTEPIRLHVSAKSYLRAIDTDFFSKLAQDSVRFLALQGGPMTLEEVAELRYDDLAKDPNAVTPGIEHFLPAINAVLSTRTAGASR